MSGSQKMSMPSPVDRGYPREDHAKYIAIRAIPWSISAAVMDPTSGDIQASSSLHLSPRLLRQGRFNYSIYSILRRILAPADVILLRHLRIAMIRERDNSLGF